MDNYMIYPGISTTDKRQVLRELRYGDKPQGKVEFAIHTVCSFFELSIQDIKSSKRTRDLVTARMIAIHYIKNHTKMSLKQIGNEFGGRDHSTIIYNLQEYEDKMDVDKKFQSTVKQINKLLKA